MSKAILIISLIVQLLGHIAFWGFYFTYSSIFEALGFLILAFCYYIAPILFGFNLLILLAIRDEKENRYAAYTFLSTIVGVGFAFGYIDGHIYLCKRFYIEVYNVNTTPIRNARIDFSNHCWFDSTETNDKRCLVSLPEIPPKTMFKHTIYLPEISKPCGRGSAYTAILLQLNNNAVVDTVFYKNSGGGWRRVKISGGEQLKIETVWEKYAGI